MRLGLAVVPFAALALAFGLYVPAPPDPGGVAHLVILHTNDMHGQALPLRGAAGPRGGLVALAAAIERERSAARRDGIEPILVDAGDLWVGPPEGERTEGRLVVDCMNELHYDAVEVGNHEFDHGPEKVAALAERARFPLLGANVKEIATGRLPAWLHESATVARDGVTVRFVGLLTSHVHEVTVEGALAGLDVEDEVSATTSVLREAAPGDLTILVTHCGHVRDQELARRFHGAIAAIVGGHTHVALAPALRVPEDSPDPVLVVQTGARTENLGRMDLLVERGTHRVLRADDRLIPVRPDAGETPQGGPPGGDRPGPVGRVEALVGAEAKECDRIFGAKVGSLDEALHAPGHGRTSKLGSLICDVVRRASGADLAFTNQGGLRADLPGGTVLWRNLREVDPFGNTLVILRFPGSELRELLEEMCAVDPLESSGLELRWDSRRPVGSRIVSVRVGGEPLDEKKTYTVATNNFLAGGGDRYTYFKRGHFAVHPTDPEDHRPVEIRNLVRAYFEKTGTVTTASLASRIVDVAKER
jgi:2',3'-cyclic-nucleotide 2'-phosphodiesterase (5'-nucleotidase family)